MARALSAPDSSEFTITYGANSLTASFPHPDLSAYKYRVCAYETATATTPLASAEVAVDVETVATLNYPFVYGQSYSIGVTALADPSNPLYADSTETRTSSTCDYQATVVDPPVCPPLVAGETFKVQDYDNSGAAKTYIGATWARLVYQSTDESVDHVAVRFKFADDGEDTYEGAWYYSDQDYTGQTVDFGYTSRGNIEFGEYTSGYWSGWKWIELTNLRPQDYISAIAKAIPASDSSYSESDVSNPVTFQLLRYEKLATPENVRCTAKTTTSLTIEWDAVDHAAGYNIDYHHPDGAVGQIEEITGTSATITGLAENSQYRIQVEAYGKTPYASSEYSDELVVKTAVNGVQLASPTVTTSNLTSSSVKLTWGAIANRSSYTAGYRKVGTSAWTNTTGLTATTVTFNNLSAATQYEYQVIAVGNGETYLDSAATIGSFTTSPETVTLSPPEDLAVSERTVDSISLTWSSVANATGYEVVCMTHVGVIKSTQTVASLTHTFTGLTAGTTYTFKAKALGDGQTYLDSDYCSTIEGKTQIKLATPTVSAFVRPSGSAKYSSLNVRLSGAIANATTYEYQLASDSNFTTDVQTKTSSTVTSGYPLSGYFTGLTEGAKYYARARAKSSNEDYATSNWSTVKNTTVTARLSAPTGLNVSNITESESTLNWNAVENASGYTVRWRKQGADAWNTQSVN